MAKIKKPLGRRREENRTDLTTEEKKSHLQIFKKSFDRFNQLYFNSKKRKNKHHFFDAMTLYIDVHQEDFYNYFYKMLK